MAHTSFSIARLVLIPTLVTLGVTVLRFAGELLGWPSPWFDKTNGLVGITWILPPMFGFYFFALRGHCLPTTPHVSLLRRGKPNPSSWPHKHHL